MLNLSGKIAAEYKRPLASRRDQTILAARLLIQTKKRKKKKPKKEPANPLITTFSFSA